MFALADISRRNLLALCAVSGLPSQSMLRGLALNASTVIIVHNHPSGDPKPSRADIDMTRRVKEACAAVGLTLHDHVVISRGGYVSFRTDGLL